MAEGGTRGAQGSRRPRQQARRCYRVEFTLAADEFAALAEAAGRPVCMTCYNAIVRAPADCARCHQSHPLIGRDSSGAGICDPCAGHAIDFTCRECGRSGYPYGRGHCAYCVLADRVAQLLAGPDGAAAAELQPLAEAFTPVHLPFTAIQWLRQSPAAAILAHLAAQQRPITHDLLDELPPDRSLHYLRQTLVQTGILTRRDEETERVPAWLEHHLAGKPAAHARLVRPFLHWSLLRRARSRAGRRQFPASAGREMRRRVLIALELLAWIDPAERSRSSRSPWRPAFPATRSPSGTPT